MKVAAILSNYKKKQNKKTKKKTVECYYKKSFGKEGN